MIMNLKRQSQLLFMAQYYYCVLYYIPALGQLIESEMIKNRSVRQIQQKPRKRLLRKNSRLKHYQSMIEEENTLHDKVVKLTMKAIGTNTVASMTPFTSNSCQSIEQNIYTEPAEAETKKAIISNFQSFQSSEIASKQDVKTKSVFDRLLKIINQQPLENIKKRKIKQIVKTQQDVLSQKYLMESSEVKTEHRKFKRSIIDKMYATGKFNKSMFDINSYTKYDILKQQTPINSNQKETFKMFKQKKPKRELKTTHFYSQTKKKVMTQRYLEEEMKINVTKTDPNEFSYISFLGSQLTRNKFLNSHRREMKYCPDLAKNQDIILSIVKFGTKDYDSLKRCLDVALDRAG